MSGTPRRAGALSAILIGSAGAQAVPDRDRSQSVGARPKADGTRRVAPFRSRAVQVSNAVRVAAALAVSGFAGLSAPAPVAAQSAGRAGPGGNLAIERLIDSGNLSEAAAALETHIAGTGLTARNLLLRGLIAYRNGRYEAALPDLQQSFALDEQDPDTSKALGMCLVRLGREDLADTFFQIAVKLAPDDAMSHYYLGLNAYTTKRFEEAREAFREAVRLRPAAAENHSYLGRSYEALGQIDLARKHYVVASELNQRRSLPSADPPLLLGTLLFRQGSLDEAKRYLRQALEYDESQALPHYWLGLLFERESELPAAIRALDRAAALAPGDHRPHYALARIHRRLGDNARAEEALQRFRELRQRSESETF